MKKLYTHPLVVINKLNFDDVLTKSINNSYYDEETGDYIQDWEVGNNG